MTARLGSSPLGRQPAPYRKAALARVIDRLASPQVGSGRKIALKGFTIKGGRLVENEKRFDVSTQLKRRGSKRVRVVRK